METHERAKIEAEVIRRWGCLPPYVEKQNQCLLWAILEEVRGLRRDLQEDRVARSATPNSSKTDRQREAEARIGQTLEAFFAAHSDASVGDLAARLGVSKSTCHAWREAGRKSKNVKESQV